MKTETQQEKCKRGVGERRGKDCRNGERLTRTEGRKGQTESV